MLGYVTAEKAELKMREYEVYSAYYCGICKSVGERYGQLPRLALSYDFVFLALLLSALSETDDKIGPEHCLIHPIKKKNIARQNEFIDYAGDMMLILGYYNLKDDSEDEHKLISGAAVKIFHRTFKKLKLKYDTICRNMEKDLALLTKSETEKCANLDFMSETFAATMSLLFTGTLQNEALSHLGRFLGKWIYIVDAWDDLEEDIQNKVYNPLLYRFSYEPPETPKAFRIRIKETVEFNMLSCLSEIAKAYDLLEIKKNAGILENIIYFGLLRKTEQLLKKGTE